MYIYTYLIHEKFSTNFLWVLKFILMLRVMVKNSNLQQVGGRSDHNVLQGPSLMGRDGRNGTDGEQKCPLIFFIFCGYIDNVHIYLSNS